MDYCRSCGSEVEAGAYQCPRCGEVFDDFEPAQAHASDEVVHHEIRELVRRAGVIAAVKRYREATGCDLKTAKEAVERLMAAGDDPLPPLEHVEADVLQIAQNQGKIAAIKRYREETRCGLKEAKEAVEDLLQQHGVRPAEPSGCAGALLLLLGIGLGLWLTR